MSLRLNDNARVAECFTSCSDTQARRQMAYLMGTHKHFSVVFVEADDDDEDDHEEGEFFFFFSSFSCASLCDSVCWCPKIFFYLFLSFPFLLPPLYSLIGCCYFPLDSFTCVPWQCLLLAGITYVALESDEVDELNEMVGNMHLHESFAFLARELDVEEAKTPEDIYKSHLAEDGGFRRKSSAAATGQQVESARANLVRLC